MRTLASWSMCPEHSTAFTDAGQLVFDARFEDGSHALMMLTIPEPAGASLTILGSVVLCDRRRRWQVGRDR